MLILVPFKPVSLMLALNRLLVALHLLQLIACIVPCIFGELPQTLQRIAKGTDRFRVLACT
jgi:hypothetical protein